MISIITPLYNEGRFVDQMVKSVRSQSYENWELILVDDGSTDDTASKVMRWSDYDSRIKVASVGEKLGKVRAFNLAYSQSNGKFVCHVGGDDFLTRDSLSMRVRALDGAPARSAVFGKLQPVDLAGQRISSAIPRGSKGSLSSPGATYSRALSEIIFPIPELLPSEDIWLGNAAVGCAEKVVHLDYPLINYRVHGGNSNPRHKAFPEMNRSLSSRYSALDLLLASDLPISKRYRNEIEAFALAEKLRERGSTLSILGLRDLPVIDRVAIASMSKPILWRMRQKMGMAASGWRGK